jgi:hypothetical protein
MSPTKPQHSAPLPPSAKNQQKILWHLSRKKRDSSYAETPLFAVTVRLPKSAAVEVVHVIGTADSNEAMTIAVEAVCDKHGIQKPAFLGIVSLKEVMAVSPVKEEVP